VKEWFPRNAPFSQKAIPGGACGGGGLREGRGGEGKLEFAN